MSPGGIVMRHRTALRANMDLNTHTTPGIFALAEPANGPVVSDFIVMILIATGTQRIVVQQALDLRDDRLATHIRLFDGDAWSSWVKQ